MTENALRVLVVDDERAIRRFLRTSLMAHGYAVYEASTGQEALSAVVDPSIPSSSIHQRATSVLSMVLRFPLTMSRGKPPSAF